MRKRLHALWSHLKNENSSPERLAASVFTGVFLGVVPLYGIQTAICLGVAWLFRLNKLTVIAAAQISLPIFAPFLIAAGIAIGEFVRFGTIRAPDLAEGRTFVENLWLLGGDVPDLFVSCFVGDTLLGLVLGVLGAAVAWWVARARQSRRNDA
ncbi:MAG: DUF2062 domain-containing protein [Myxococcota bacterium]